MKELKKILRRNQSKIKIERIVKVIQFLTAILMLPTFLCAQNTSYISNTIPIGGINSCAFGPGTLSNNIGVGNIAIGYYALELNTSGNFNTAISPFALSSNTIGTSNFAGGYAALDNNTSGNNNTAIGASALASNTTGFNNFAGGLNALRFNSTGTSNTATGVAALYSNTTASKNTANGYEALKLNTIGENNTALGFSALYSNTTAGKNFAGGCQALYSNTTGSFNVAIGYASLFKNTGGSSNVATGNEALYSNITGHSNTAIGDFSLRFNTASSNTAVGSQALYLNSTGNSNSATGTNALAQNTTGNNNVAFGNNSMFNNLTGFQNTGIGTRALYSNQTGNSNTALGWSADVNSINLVNATALGASALVNLSNKVRIGSSTVTIVEGPVDYTFSDGRFKSNIREEDVVGLEFIKKLRPVVYNLDTKKIAELWTKNMKEEDRKKYFESQDFGPSTAIRQSGFIAQEVEQAAKQVGYNFNGVHVSENDNDNYSLAYSEFVVPLVKGMQEQQKMIEELKLQIQNLTEMNSTNSLSSNVNSLGNSKLFQNNPNPFSRETKIEFTLDNTIKTAVLYIYDLTGKQIEEYNLNDRGSSSILINANQLMPGTYLYTLIGDGIEIGTKKMIITR